MLLADLKSMAVGMGISGAGSMKKAQLVDAIKAAQTGAPSSAPAGASSSDSTGAPVGAQAAAAGSAPRVTRTQRPARRVPASAPSEPADTSVSAEQPTSGASQSPPSGDAARPDSSSADSGSADSGSSDQQRTSRQRTRNQARQQDDAPRDGQGSDKGADKGSDKGSDKPVVKGQDQKSRQPERQQDRPERQQDRQAADQQAGNQQGKQSGNQQANQQPGNQQGNQGNQQDQDQDDDGEGGGRRNRRRRGRDRDRTVPRPGNRNEPDTTVLEDDVLVPAAGILDVLDNYAFVRTSGYLPGTDDVYLSLSMVRKFGLRRGDAIVGQVRQPREGERKEKFNPMVRIDSVNGADPEAARDRAEFDSFTPVHPDDRLRLETDSANLVGRTIDLVAPLGKGQRALLLAPPGTGTTSVLQSVAASISRNNPECHLMIVLLDERPEEVTDFQRSVKGEVIASTFDRPATDHTMVAELAIERAKRLVELGHDVVVLLDSLTQLGRSYNLAAPANGRLLSGGVDATALHPPKAFFGAARNIEQGGSLTIVASALVDTGSMTDEVILEEFTGTANSVVRLAGDVAARRTFPAIDVLASGTRREDLLLTREEHEITEKLRRSLLDRTAVEANEDVLGRVRATQSNIELLTQVQRTPAAAARRR